VLPWARLFKGRAQVNLEFPDQLLSLCLRNFPKKVGDEVFLSALTKNHAVDGQCPAQLIEPFHLTAERKPGDMALNFCVTREQPKGNKLVLSGLTSRKPCRENLLPGISSG